MIYVISSCLFFCSCVFQNAEASPTDVVNSSQTHRVPDWIWLSPSNPKASSVGDQKAFVFETSLPLSELPRTATLRFANDFCTARIVVQGKTLVEVEPYSETIVWDITQSLQVGTNTIQIETQRDPLDENLGPPAIAASIEVGLGDRRIETLLVTDSKWTVRSNGQTVLDLGTAVTRGPVDHAMWGMNRRSLHLDPTENYEQWRQAVSGSNVEGKQFWTAPGFTVTHVRNATDEEGSWVSMAFDKEGRLTIAREDKGLLRMTFDDSHTRVNLVETINEQLMECRGLVYAHGSLYANANNSRGLFRLDDTKGDDTFESSKELRAFPGGVGHGRNDLAVGQDGWIYSIHGDSVELPVDRFIDRTSPLRDQSHRGKETSKPAGQGHVVRTDANGSQWELYCTGLRNPFGIAQHRSGDWFTYDADAEFDMGAPWYRPTRVVQLVAGADYGWRSVTGKWPPYYPDHPDNSMPTLDIGKGSPTAVEFAYGSHFPAEYRNALMILDWTYGRVLAVHLYPRGAGYRASAETFLQGRPLNVTDLCFGPDGAMYLITGGRKTQSALYRVAYTSRERNATDDTPHNKESAQHANEMRAIRMRLEAMQTDKSAWDETPAWKCLNSADWQLRYAARTAIEFQPREQWQARALTETRVQASVESCLALMRTKQSELYEPILNRLLSMEPAACTLGQQLGILYFFSECWMHSQETILKKKVEVAAFLEVLCSQLGTHPRISRNGTSATAQGHCLRLLSALGSDQAVEHAFTTLLLSTDQSHRIDGLFAIRSAQMGWTDARRREYLRVLQDGSRLLKGEGMDKFLRQIRDDFLSAMPDETREKLAEAIDGSSVQSLQDMPVVLRPIIKKWSTEELEKAVETNRHAASRDRGKVVFGEAQCSRCHRAEGQGGTIGPDLTFIGNRFTHRDLLISLLEPSRVIAENYRNAHVITKEGTTHTGRLLLEGDYRSERVFLATDPYSMKGNVEIAKSDIQEFRESKTSPMPSGLLDSFNAQEIVDLIAYLQGATKQ